MNLQHTFTTTASIIGALDLFTRVGGPASAYAALASGMGVWLVARFALDLDMPYLLALAAAFMVYLGFSPVGRGRI